MAFRCLSLIKGWPLVTWCCCSRRSQIAVARPLTYELENAARTRTVPLRLCRIHCSCSSSKRDISQAFARHREAIRNPFALQAPGAPRVWARLHFRCQSSPWFSTEGSLPFMQSSSSNALLTASFSTLRPMAPRDENQGVLFPCSKGEFPDKWISLWKKALSTRRA
jgi:hypothetical protein